MSVRDEFSAAHALRHYEGKCERLHGHNFSVELTVEGAGLDVKTGMVVDFKILKGALKKSLEELDHQLLNELEPFGSQNPSSENLARHILTGAARILAGEEAFQSGKARIIGVTVSEKDSQSATYLVE